MIGYAMFGTNNLPRALTFYDGLMSVLSAKRLFGDGNFQVYGVDAPSFGITKPYNLKRATAGNGSMIALAAPSRAKVDEAHAKALALGGADEGAPGIRGGDGSDFYAAYFRDLDGNKFCVFKTGPAD
jgi:catechol 2,3-dioxygenase-like lactoylglutathione lyase family enzyme